MSLPGEARQVGIAESIADRCSLGEDHSRGSGVARHLLERLRNEQVAALDAVDLALVQQPLRSRRPTGGLCALARVNEGERQPKCHLRCACWLTAFEADVVAAGEQPVRALIALASQVGCDR